MVGAIGLTENGQLLDKYLTLNPNPHVVKFVQKITAKTSCLRRSCQDNLEFLLSLLRNHYEQRLENEFCHLDAVPYKLLKKYILEITKWNFKPSTKTQLALLKKNRLVNQCL